MTQNLSIYALLLVQHICHLSKPNHSLIITKQRLFRYSAIQQYCDSFVVSTAWLTTVTTLVISYLRISVMGSRIYFTCVYKESHSDSNK